MGDAFPDSCQDDGGLRQESRVQLYMPRTGARLNKRVCNPPRLSFKTIPGIHRAEAGSALVLTLVHITPPLRWLNSSAVCQFGVLNVTSLILSRRHFRREQDCHDS